MVLPNDRPGLLAQVDRCRETLRTAKDGTTRFNAAFLLDLLEQRLNRLYQPETGAGPAPAHPTSAPTATENCNETDTIGDL